MKPAGALALVINTYGQSKYLGRLLAAVSRQTRRSKEVLLADDGFVDDTRAVFERWAGAQTFRTGHVWPKNKGLRRSRIFNEAIARVHSDYLGFLAGRGWARGDQRWHPPASRGNRDINDGLLAHVQREGGTHCAYGLDPHLPATTA